MSEEVDALSGAKFSSGGYISDFPCKVRILTRDPMVYVDKYGNTKYSFAAYNLDTGQVAILDKGPGFPKRFQEINADPDFGGDIRRVDLKITTNGKSGLEVRYTITPVGSPSDLSAETVKEIVANGFDLAERVKKNNPGALRLSEINAGKKLPTNAGVEPEYTGEVDPEEEIDLNSIPF